MKWMWLSMPPAVIMPFAGDDLGAGADHDRHAGLDVRVAGLADAGDAPALQADVGLDDAPVTSMISALVMTVSAVTRRRPGPGPCRRGSPCRRRI